MGKRYRSKKVRGGKFKTCKDLPPPSIQCKKILNQELQLRNSEESSDILSPGRTKKKGDCIGRERSVVTKQITTLKSSLGRKGAAIP